MKQFAGGRSLLGRSRAWRICPLAAMAVHLATSAAAAPPIRTHAANSVPACVTPDRLMTFLAARNPDVDPRYSKIASLFKHWGEAWRVRWDYAFFQMALETNFLKYRRPNGRRGDVHEAQNNFAGLGATGGGVAGDRFADVSTGVHAQIQHLVAYSGERLERPIAPRTALKQDHIVSASLRLNRSVTFGDLARRWAADRHYARSIDFVAGQFNAQFCNDDGTAAARLAPLPPPVWKRGGFLPPSGLGGPKPSALAGPELESADEVEVLPWATTPAPRDPPARSAATPKPKPAQRRDNAPVRTLWSRDAHRNVESLAVVVPPAAPSPAATEPQPAARPEPEQAGFFLPWFRISPADPPGPSRLGGPVPKLEPPAPAVWTSPDIAAPAQAPGCRVLKASYGGRKTLLVRSTIDGEQRLTALTVLDGFEKSMFETYARAAAPGAVIVGEYDDQDHALADARANCPGGG